MGELDDYGKVQGEPERKWQTLGLYGEKGPKTVRHLILTFGKDDC